MYILIAHYFTFWFFAHLKFWHFAKITQNHFSVAFIPTYRICRLLIFPRDAGMGPVSWLYSNSLHKHKVHISLNLYSHITVYQVKNTNANKLSRVPKTIMGLICDKNQHFCNLKSTAMFVHIWINVIFMGNTYTCKHFLAFPISGGISPLNSLSFIWLQKTTKMSTK